MNKLMPTNLHNLDEMDQFLEGAFFLNLFLPRLTQREYIICTSFSVKESGDQ